MTHDAGPRPDDPATMIPASLPTARERPTPRRRTDPQRAVDRLLPPPSRPVTTTCLPSS